MTICYSLFLSIFLAPTLVSPSLNQSAQDVYFQKLTDLCGSTFQGYSSYPDDPDDAFAGKLLVAHFKSCNANEIQISFAVGNDTSRTWIISRGPKGLLLKHDHRHKDGTPDEITMYGGWATEKGTATSQWFAADQHTIKLIPAAATNVWQIALDLEKNSLTYYLERHQKPRFKATLKKK